MTSRAATLALPALEIRQTATRWLYSFAVDGKLLSRFAAVSRVHRTSEMTIGGYQRPEVASHVAGIRAYLESEDPLLPNAIVVAFDSRVRFVGHTRGTRGYARAGELLIPTDPRWEEGDKPGWIVDGQQRVAAVREAQVDAFPLCVTAFITDSAAEQRTQFILVNHTKPLQPGLVRELLPDTEGTLPRLLRHKRFPSRLLEQLNNQRLSPLRRMIATPTRPEGVIKDNSIIRMLENSLTDGALYHLRDPRTGAGDVEAILAILFDYWDTVREAFPDAWGLPARRSRLMHGAGIVSMGFFMDAICDRFLPRRYPKRHEFAAEVAKIAPACKWTSGHWDFSPLPRRWNDLQNTPRDVQILTDFLLTRYEADLVGRPLRVFSGDSASARQTRE
jgi:DGQHR domain-containing protein